MAVDRLWLVRHAESTSPHVFNGAEADVELSETGVRQAEALAQWFRKRQPTAVVSSGMRRAFDTAAPTARVCEVPHTVESDLHERRIGVLSGTEFRLDAGPWPETVRQWVSGNTAYTTPGAESFDDIVARCLPAIERVVAAHPSGRVAVVAHGVVCKVLLLRLLGGYGPADWSRLGAVSNVSVSELVPDGAGWRAERLLEVPETVLSLTVNLQIHPADVIRLRSEA